MNLWEPMMVSKRDLARRLSRWLRRYVNNVNLKVVLELLKHHICGGSVSSRLLVDGSCSMQ
jgi:hypothetical protein